MRIALDYRPLQTGYADHGVGTFWRNIFSRLLKSKLASSLVFCGLRTDNLPEAIRYRRIWRPRYHKWFWEQVLWPFDIKRLRVNIFHSTVSLGIIRDMGFPLFCPAKSIATIFDLNCLKIPEFAWHSRTRSFRIQWRAVKKADRIVTISDYVKNDIVNILEVPEGMVAVLPCAVDDTLRTIFDTKSFEDTSHMKPFILGMGDAVNKNVHTTLAVFERLADRGFSGDLCMVGAFDKQTEKTIALWRKSVRRERIHFYGDVSTEKLVEFYAKCEFFIFPSTCEGFGLPVIEAMYCGAPVLTSNVTSLPEAGGDAAVFCSPYDVDGFVREGWRLLHDKQHKRECVEKGRRHARSRTWDNAVDELLSVYEELCSTAA